MPVSLLVSLSGRLIPMGTLIFRMVLEDRTLRDELEGYADYARRVTYRLLAGAW
jgi:protein-S-isoprenylcysteine O-methyltransferase Ste14